MPNATNPYNYWRRELLTSLKHKDYQLTTLNMMLAVRIKKGVTKAKKLINKTGNTIHVATCNLCMGACHPFFRILRDYDPLFTSGLYVVVDIWSIGFVIARILRCGEIRRTVQMNAESRNDQFNFLQSYTNMQIDNAAILD